MAGWEATNNDNDPFFAKNRRENVMGIEMPGGPQLDHYYGRGVEGIEMGEDDEPSNWSILLSGGVRIRNHDTDRETAPASERFGGLSLLSATLSEKDTRLVFGISRPAADASDRREQLVLTPTQYEIVDPNIAGGPHFPQRPPELQDDESVFPGREAEENDDPHFREDEENGD
jgi:hypothetical protein